MALLTSCIVADPPQYEEPKQTPPILDLAGARPYLGDVIVIDRTDNEDANDKVELKVPVRSDDQGDPLNASLWLDYSFFPSIYIGVFTKIPPSTLDDQTRTINMVWSLGEAPPWKAGCHPLTMLVSHESNWDNDHSRPDLVKAENDLAIATWWVNLDPEPGAAFTLKNCPSKTEIER
jgi:hypothetical protein